MDSHQYVKGLRGFPVPRRLTKLRDVPARVGFVVSYSSLRRWQAAGKIECYRQIGGARGRLFMSDKQINAMLRKMVRPATKTD